MHYINCVDWDTYSLNKINLKNNCRNKIFEITGRNSTDMFKYISKINFTISG